MNTVAHLHKFETLKNRFSLCETQEEKYQEIIKFGKDLPPFNPEAKIEKNLVFGCQSVLYLESIYRDGKLYFNAFSEALISKGLAAVLISVYSGEDPLWIFQTPPSFLQKLGLLYLFTSGRINGLDSVYLKMQQETFPYLGS